MQRLRLHHSFLRLHLCLSSMFNECTHARHAPQVLQPTSKPGRPHTFIIAKYYGFLYLCSFIFAILLHEPV